MTTIHLQLGVLTPKPTLNNVLWIEQCTASQTIKTCVTMYDLTMLRLGGLTNHATNQ